MNGGLTELLVCDPSQFLSGDSQTIENICEIEIFR